MKLWVDVSIDEPDTLWAFTKGVPYPYTLAGDQQIVRGWSSLERLLDDVGEPDGIAMELGLDEIVRRIGDRGWDVYQELGGGKRRILRVAKRGPLEIAVDVPPAARELLSCQRCGQVVGAGEEESFGRCPNCGGRSLDPIGAVDE